MEESKRRLMNGPKYLSFDLAQEEYCISILRVREILGLPPITPIPQTPEFIRGVMNLRGTIIPVIDLRLKFLLPFREYGDRTSVIVVTLPQAEGAMHIGVVVDTIHEVVAIADETITKLPYINARVKSEYLHGFTEAGNRFRILLNIDRVLDESDLGSITSIQTSNNSEGVSHE